MKHIHTAPSKEAAISCLEILTSCVKDGDFESPEYLEAKELLALLLNYLQNMQARK